jgi:hypothetical protein
VASPALRNNPTFISSILKRIEQTAAAAGAFRPTEPRRAMNAVEIERDASVWDALADTPEEAA